MKALSRKSLNGKLTVFHFQQHLLVLMAGQQATDKPYTPPQVISKNLKKDGVQVYSVGVGPKVSSDEIIGVASGADYALKINYPKLQTAAAFMAPAVVECKI